MPAPDGKGGFLQRRLRSSEFARWVERCVKAKKVVKKGQAIGARSGKTTLLAWCARFGVDKGSRRALGYHVPPKDRSVNVYSRDYQAAPMRRLLAVEKAIMVGDLRPWAFQGGGW